MNSRTLFPPDTEKFTRSLTDDTLPVTDDVVGLRSVMVNVYFIANPDGTWVLVDAGLPFSGPGIRAMAQKLFGDRPPEAILLTHGHFDHTGVVVTLANEWNADVYAHPLEMPYLTGRSSYAPPDPWVGGLMAVTSPLYPRSPVDLGDRAKTLPDDGTVPFLDGWRWIHTPGHSPGHVSLFRDADRTLIAGDAFITTRQESLLAVMGQAAEVHGPPMYFTPDWDHAARSVRTLAELRPAIAATGHGIPMGGEALDGALDRLARDFEAIAVPRHGRYVGCPAVTDENGLVWIPPDVAHPGRMIAATVLGLMAGLWLARRSRPRDPHRS